MLIKELINSGQIVGFDSKEWTKTIPTSPGTLWWFYGRTYVEGDEEYDPHLYLVQIYKTHDVLWYLANTKFFMPGQSEGMWLRIDPICLPNLEMPHFNESFCE